MEAELASKMGIELGSTVVGTGGKLGEVHRVIVEHTQPSRVSEIIVKHGFLFGGEERVVPVGRITRIEDGVVYLDLDEHGLAAMDGFADGHYRTPGAGSAGPAGRDGGEGALLMAAAAEGATIGLSGGLLGFPDGNGIAPHDPQRVAIRIGMPVDDADGERVGEISAASLAADTGSPTRLVLRSGFLFKHDTELPLDWVEDITEEGILLKVSKAEAQTLEQKRIAPHV